MTGSVGARVALEAARGSLLPHRYEGDLRTCVITGGDGVVLGEGVRFSDGRCGVSLRGGVVWERYATPEVMAGEWAGRGVVVWCDGGDCPPERVPRRFLLLRLVDASGFSGPGVATEGVRFSHGGVALRWLGEVSSLVEWPSIELAVATHGHAGGTVVQWLDGEDGGPAVVG